MDMICSNFVKLNASIIEACSFGLSPGPGVF